VPGLAALFMAGMIWLLAAMLPASVTPALQLACKVFIGGIAYLGCVWLLAPSVLNKLADTIGHAFRRPGALANVPTTI
jgi:hypothetical protein